MSQDGLKFPEIKVVNNPNDSIWVDYGNFVKEFSSHADAKNAKISSLNSARKNSDVG